MNEPEVESAPRPKNRRSGRPVNPDAKYLQSRSVTNDLRVSTSDPDAQLFYKVGETPLLAHKTQMMVDGGAPGIITAVDVRPACEADSHAVGRMLDKHRVAVGRPARELVGDTGYGREDAFKECLMRGVQPTLRIRNLGNVHGSFTRDRFNYVPEHDVFIILATQMWSVVIANPAGVSRIIFQTQSPDAASSAASNPSFSSGTGASRDALERLGLDMSCHL